MGYRDQGATLEAKIAECDQQLRELEAENLELTQQIARRRSTREPQPLALRRPATFGVLVGGLIVLAGASIHAGRAQNRREVEAELQREYVDYGHELERLESETKNSEYDPKADDARKQLFALAATKHCEREEWPIVRAAACALGKQDIRRRVRENVSEADRDQLDALCGQLDEP